MYVRTCACVRSVNNQLGIRGRERECKAVVAPLDSPSLRRRESRRHLSFSLFTEPEDGKGEGGVGAEGEEWTRLDSNARSN